jgi:hypothetical protein
VHRTKSATIKKPCHDSTRPARIFLAKSSKLEFSRMSSREFRWQLSERQWAYLGWLARNTGLGRTEKDVAQALLTQKIQEMRLAYYSEPHPEDLPDVGGTKK